jgi:2-polyprenyl-3-methyl-5-hydroxy-6-metoxy-1,4-benzoquinol methylase
MSDVKCRACGSINTELSPVHAAGWFEEGYRYWRCADCGCDTSTAAYRFGLYDNTIQANAYEWEYALRCLNTNVRLLVDNGAAAGMTFVDYGTGDGAFMKRMADLGLEVYGFEVSQHALDVIVPRLNLPPGRMFTDPAQLDGRQFDVVATREVAEHVEDPGALIARVAGMTKPGGVLQVQTPQAGDEHHPMIYQTAHLCVLSVRKLSQWITGLGFEIIDHLTWPLGQCVTARRRL